MTESVFPYPGGKGRYADWILQQFPHHETYVEPFGGAGTVLLNKPKSKVEVYNDADGDLVQFFEVLRDRCDELSEWVDSTPYSRELYERYAGAFYNGNRPDDPVERAGRFFYLRYTQFAGKYESEAGFSTSPTTKAGPKGYRNAKEKLQSFSGRLSSVTVESRDYRDLIPLYDTPQSLFYCDPPYYGTEGAYLHTDFSHGDLADSLSRAAGKWIVSYSELPPAFEGIPNTHIFTRDGSVQMDVTGGSRKSKPETLVMNYNPEQTPSFSQANQATLTEVADGG